MKELIFALFLQIVFNEKAHSLEFKSFQDKTHHTIDKISSIDSRKKKRHPSK